MPFAIPGMMAALSPGTGGLLSAAMPYLAPVMAGAAIGGLFGGLGGGGKGAAGGALMGGLMGGLGGGGATLAGAGPWAATGIGAGTGALVTAPQLLQGGGSNSRAMGMGGGYPQMQAPPNPTASAPYQSPGNSMPVGGPNMDFMKYAQLFSPPRGGVY